MRRRARHKANIAMYFAAILFCLVMITTWMAGGLLAKYNSSDSNENGARAAAFVFDTSAILKAAEEGEIIVPITDICKPGDQSVYILNVTNGLSNVVSEVDESYVITVSKQGSMPLKCTLKNSDNKAAATPDDKILAERDSITSADIADNSALLAASVPTTHEYTLTIEWPVEENHVKYASGSAVGEIRLAVRVQQED